MERSSPYRKKTFLCVYLCILIDFCYAISITPHYLLCKYVYTHTHIYGQKDGDQCPSKHNLSHHQVGMLCAMLGKVNPQTHPPHLKSGFL